MGYDVMPPRWQKTKGAILVLCLVLAGWGAYKGYWTYQWAKAGLFKAHDAHGFLVSAVRLPDGQQYLTITDAQGAVQVVPMSQVLNLIASERAKAIVDASAAKSALLKDRP